MIDLKFLSGRLKFAISEKEKAENITITNAKIAAIAGVSRTSVTHWMSGGGINAVQARLIAEYLGVNPIWLEIGKGDIYKNNNKNAQQDDITINQYVDVRGAMGSGLLLRDQPGQITKFTVNTEWMNKNIPTSTGKENLAIVTGFGDSMRGMFNSGDPLLVDTGIKSLDYDGVYFFRVGNEGFIKRLQRIPGEGIRAISTNKEYESWTITKDMDFEVFGRVLKVWNSEDF